MAAHLGEHRPLARLLVRDALEGLLQGDGEELVGRFHAGEGAIAHHVGPEAAQSRPDHLAGGRVGAQLPGKRQQPQGEIEVHRAHVGATAQAHPLGLGLLVVLAELQVGAVGADERVDVLARLRVLADGLETLALLLQQLGRHVGGELVDEQIHRQGHALAALISPLHVHRPLADLDQQGVAGLRIGAHGDAREVDPLHLLGDPVHEAVPVAIAPVEAPQEVAGIHLAPGDGVEVLLHRRGEAKVHVAREVIAEQADHGHADVGGQQRAALLLHVVALLDGGDDGRVGGRPADPLVLQLLDQRGLGVPGRRLGLVA